MKFERKFNFSHSDSFPFTLLSCLDKIHFYCRSKERKRKRKWERRKYITKRKKMTVKKKEAKTENAKESGKERKYDKK
jgi:hypothetical protein